MVVVVVDEVVATVAQRGLSGPPWAGHSGTVWALWSPLGLATVAQRGLSGAPLGWPQWHSVGFLGPPWAGHSGAEWAVWD